MVRGCGVPMKALPAPQTFTLREKNCELRYPLELLCSVASTHCLGSVACHELITLKHTALLSLSEDGWAKIEKDTRLGLLALGRSWIGWHGFGRRLFFLYLMDRGWRRRRGHRGQEFDPDKLTEYQTSLGYHLCLALTPKYVKVFNCKNRLKSCEFVNDGDAEIAQLAGGPRSCAREFVAHCLQIYSFGLPFKGVVIHDFADVIFSALTAPAYSEVNCEASGVLSGTMDITSSLMRYESSHFKVTRNAVGEYLVTIRGVDVGTGEVRYAEDYPSDLINADLVVADVKSYLLFNHAAKAPAEERESVQVEGMAKCVKSLRRPLQELVDALYRSRVRAMPKAPAEHAGSTFEESIQGLFRELPFWHKKHPMHDKRGTKMMRMYKSKVVGIAPISSDACARRWSRDIVSGFWKQSCIFSTGSSGSSFVSPTGSKPFSGSGSGSPARAPASSASAISSLPLVPWMTSGAPDPSSMKSSRARDSQLSLDTMDDERESHPELAVCAAAGPSSGAGASEAAQACDDLRPAELRAR
ncbi:hypothetical protein JL722_9043 [Aureococcus anophagefferens]|nr:hypothetical protein JL722_9043 [Aureococcus anophagefferens]